MTAAERSILHVDMDAFYASVEQRDDPALRGRPVIVGGGSNRGVVAAASYEARRFGIRSAMPVAEAMRRCPELVRVRSRMAHYGAVSRRIFAIFREFTPLVEGLSLDEAFLDVSASTALFGDPKTIAASIKARIREETQLSASVGVAGNKLIAKIASDLDKPDGLTVLYPLDYPEKLDPLPVSVIPGIGPRTERRLAAMNITTVEQLRLAPERDLVRVFGKFANRARERASGRDDRPVVPAREGKSISAEETYDADLDQPDQMERELLRLTERMATRLRRSRLAASTIHVKIRQSDFSTCTRQRRVTPAASGTEQICAVACELLRAWLRQNPGARVRLLGVGGSDLVPIRQPDLFAATESANSRVDKTVDKIRDRFGSASLERARTLDRQ